MVLHHERVEGSDHSRTDVLVGIRQLRNWKATWGNSKATDFAPGSWRFEYGSLTPEWLMAAMTREDIMPHPRPKEGEINWARPEADVKTANGVVRAKIGDTIRWTGEHFEVEPK